MVASVLVWVVEQVVPVPQSVQLLVANVPQPVQLPVASVPQSVQPLVVSVPQVQPLVVSVPQEVAALAPMQDLKNSFVTNLFLM